MLTLNSAHRASIWGVVGTTGQAAGRWACLVVLAKLGSAEVVGIFALGQAIANPLTALARFAFRPIIATDINSEFRFSDYLIAQVLTAAIYLATLGVITWAAGLAPGVGWTIFLIGIAKLVDVFGDFFYGVLQKHDRMRQIGLSTLSKGIGAVFAVSLTYAATHSLALTAVAMGSWWLVVLATYDVPSVIRILQFESIKDGAQSGLLRHKLWRVFQRCFPVAASGTLKQVNQNLPRYLIQFFLGSAAMGHFAAIAAFANFGQVVFRGITQASSARLAEFQLHNRPRFFRLLFNLLGVAAALGLAAVGIVIVMGDSLLALLYRADYAVAAGVLTWMMIAATFALTALVLRTAMIAARCLTVQVPQLVLTTLLLLVACRLLIPPFGLYGAAWATIAACVFESLAAVAVLAFHFRDDLRTFNKSRRSTEPHPQPVLQEESTRT